MNVDQVFRETLRVRVPVTGTHYTAGDVVGKEQRLSLCYSQIVAVQLYDPERVIGAVSLFLFDEPSAPVPDNAPNRWSDESMTHCLGVIYLPTPSNGVSQLSNPSGWPLLLVPPAPYAWCSIVTSVTHRFETPGAELQLTWTGVRG